MIVHEAWLKLSQANAASFADRDHYLATAARAMRQILVDHARKKLSAKRGAGAVHVEFDESRNAADEAEEKFVALDDALGGLAAKAPELERVVEMRFFAGLTVEETAAALNSSVRTVERQWARARAYLAQELDR